VGRLRAASCSRWRRSAGESSRRATILGNSSVFTQRRRDRREKAQSVTRPMGSCEGTRGSRPVPGGTQSAAPLLSHSPPRDRRNSGATSARTAFGLTQRHRDHRGMHFIELSSVCLCASVRTCVWFSRRGAEIAEKKTAGGGRHRKALLMLAIAAFSLVQVAAAQTGAATAGAPGRAHQAAPAGGCGGCTQKVAAEAVVQRPVSEFICGPFFFSQATWGSGTTNPNTF